MGDAAAIRDLVRRARTGDTEALGNLLENHRTQLETLAGRQLSGRLQARVGASDIVQQTFLEAHRAFGEFRGSGEPEFVAWLKRILDRNLAGAIRDHAMVAKRAVGRQRSLDDSQGRPVRPAELAGRQSSPSHRAIRSEEADRLLRILQTLPADQRLAVRLRHLDGKSLAKIAQQLGRSPAAAASLIKRGMQALRKQLPCAAEKPLSSQ